MARKDIYKSWITGFRFHLLVIAVMTSIIFGGLTKRYSDSATSVENNVTSKSGNGTRESSFNKSGENLIIVSIRPNGTKWLKIGMNCPLYINVEISNLSPEKTLEIKNPVLFVPIIEDSKGKRIDEKLEPMRLSQDLKKISPSNSIILSWLLSSPLLPGDYHVFFEDIEKAIEVDGFRVISKNGHIQITNSNSPVSLCRHFQRKILALKGQMDDALLAIKKELKKEPDNISLRMEEIELLLDAKRPSEARDSLYEIYETFYKKGKKPPCFFHQALIAIKSQEEKRWQ